MAYFAVPAGAACAEEKGAALFPCLGSRPATLLFLSRMTSLPTTLPKVLLPASRKARVVSKQDTPSLARSSTLPDHWDHNVPQYLPARKVGFVGLPLRLLVRVMREGLRVYIPLLHLVERRGLFTCVTSTSLHVKTLSGGLSSPSLPLVFFASSLYTLTCPVTSISISASRLVSRMYK